MPQDDADLVKLLTLAGQMLETRRKDVLRRAMTEDRLDETVQAWVQTRELADTVKALKAEIDDLVTTLRDEHVPWQIDIHNADHGLKEGAAVRHALGLIKITHHVKASVGNGMKPEAYAWLRKHNLGGIIIETISAQTLAKTARELIEAKKDLPPDLFTVSTHRYATFEKDQTDASDQAPWKNRSTSPRAGSGAEEPRRRTSPRG
ncbi:MAG: hypothetical protein ABWY64_16945 [Tardiphaga sp.]